ncbi:hypothetical protein Rsub_06921 [Raphidocelis subcapitata]|uniref:Hemerythrin-like domain-containing protein n=1 Tax=Raphidocelis subcapitata TaxID=307507 RepID=A0A2V0P3Z1_9CHLO|nr:hypothetical protein Rsub_06921 [Raphidocelis subcapitata]|eukprot:GBF94299.1 hypothetical protein Rsub_06921 [Raphidocelis subcapitata]
MSEQAWEDAEEGEPGMDLDVERVEDISSQASCATRAIPWVANDHDLIKGLYKKYRSPGLPEAERERLVTEMVRVLDAHVQAEEEVLCPALAKESEIGEFAREHALSVDSSLRLLLCDLTAMRAGAEGFGAKLEQLMAVFFQHMAEEEHALPVLRGAVGADELLELGSRFKAVKDDALARPPHPPTPPVHA